MDARGSKVMNDPAASGQRSAGPNTNGGVNPSFFSRVASVTLDPKGKYFLCQLRFSGVRERSERLPRISSPRCGAGYETHWWESIENFLSALITARTL